MNNKILKWHKPYPIRMIDKSNVKEMQLPLPSPYVIFIDLNMPLKNISTIIINESGIIYKNIRKI